jgi:hypothetical protein
LGEASGEKLDDGIVEELQRDGPGTLKDICERLSKRVYAALNVSLKPERSIRMALPASTACPNLTYGGENKTGIGSRTGPPEGAWAGVFRPWRSYAITVTGLPSAIVREEPGGFNYVGGPHLRLQSWREAAMCSREARHVMEPRRRHRVDLPVCSDQNCFLSDFGATDSVVGANLEFPPEIPQRLHLS